MPITINQGGSFSLKSGASFSVGSGGGGGSIDPNSLSNISARYVASDAINYGYQLDLPENQDRTPTIGAAGGFSYSASSPSYNNLPVTGWAWASGVSPGYMGSNPNKLLIPGYSKARTVYYVGDLLNSSVNTFILNYGTDSYGDNSPEAGPRAGWFRIVVEGGEIKIRSRSIIGGSWVEADSQAQPISSGVPFVLSYSYVENTDVNANTMYINGAAASGSAGTPGLLLTGSDGGDPIYVRNGSIQFGDPSAPWSPNVKVAELFIFNGNHDSSTRQGVESFLMSKYAITA